VTFLLLALLLFVGLAGEVGVGLEDEMNAFD